MPKSTIILPNKGTGLAVDPATTLAIMLHRRGRRGHDALLFSQSEVDEVLAKYEGLALTSFIEEEYGMEDGPLYRLELKRRQPA